MGSRDGGGGGECGCRESRPKRRRYKSSCLTSTSRFLLMPGNPRAGSLNPTLGPGVSAASYKSCGLSRPSCPFTGEEHLVSQGGKLRQGVHSCFLPLATEERKPQGPI